MSERVFIIGPGHVGRGLFRAFRASGVEVVGLHGKRPSGVATSVGNIPADAARANVVILCVRDPQLDEAIAEVSAAAADGRIARGAVVLHTSAIAEPAGLRALSATGFPGGTFHPLVPFSDPEVSAELLRKGWIGIDGENAAKNASRRLAGHLGARTLEIPPGKKPAYHAAAVIASNFPVVLASVAGHLDARSVGKFSGGSNGTATACGIDSTQSATTAATASPLPTWPMRRSHGALAVVIVRSTSTP